MLGLGSMRCLAHPLRFASTRGVGLYLMVQRVRTPLGEIKDEILQLFGRSYFKYCYKVD